MQKTKIIFLQEHWLYNFETNLLGEILKGWKFQVKCVDDSNPICHESKPRGHAGVLTAWHQDIDHLVTPLPDGTERIVTTQLNNNRERVTLINTYMPTVGTQDSYGRTLDEVHEIISKYEKDGPVVWLGDMNASGTRPNPHTNDKMFIDFCKEMELVDFNPKTPTYYHFIGGITSNIDHIITQKQTDIIGTTWVDERHPENTSSHDAVFTTLRMDTQQAEEASKESRDIARPKPNWKKIDVTKYNSLTSQKLNAFVEYGGLDLPTEVQVERLYDILLSSEDESSQKGKSSKKRKKGAPLWGKELKPLVQESKLLFYLWKQAGRPLESELYTQMKGKKKELRAAQREMAALQRQATLAEITCAETDNRNLFYKLIRKQRSSHHAIPNDMRFPSEVSDQMEGWANYFEDLASNKPLPHFDEEHHSRAKMIYHLNALETVTKEDLAPPLASHEEIRKYIRTLKNDKAADVYGLTAEHIKLASSEIITVLQRLTNKIIEERKMPEKFKVGALVPAHKKQKPIKNPDSYRRITIASNLGKVVERHMMAITKPAARKKQDPLQFGFTEEISSITCALLVTEAIAEASDNGTPLYLTFLDSSKAFDMVDRTVMLNAMHSLELSPSLWSLYDDMYSSVTSRVRINGELSRPLVEKRGIRQGGETSTETFKAKDNSFLGRVRNHPTAYRIGSTSIGIPTVADDNCMLATSHNEVQTQLLLAEDNAARDRYLFSVAKSKVVHLAGETHSRLPLIFNDKEIDYSENETHLGIARTSDGKAAQAVRDRIKTGRRTAYSLMGAGLHGVNGLSPQVSRKLISTYVDPVILFGLEAMILSPSDYEQLEKYQRTLLRQVQSLPDSTAKSAIYLLIGVLPLQAQIHQRILSLFINVAHATGSSQLEIIERQLAMKSMDSKSWTTAVKSVLYQYDLPSPSEVIVRPPDKSTWKRTCKKKIREFWETRLKTQAATMKSLSSLNLAACSIGETHHVWATGHDPRSTEMAAVKARLLVGRYPITASSYAGLKKQMCCPLCHLDPETIEHFILKCQSLGEHRMKYMRKLSDTIEKYCIKNDTELLTFLLDPSHYVRNREELLNVEDLTRRLCYSLHSQRARLLQEKSTSTEGSPA